MAEEFEVETLRDEFYRDSFIKVICLIGSFIVAFLALVALSIYLYLDKPPPVVFPVQKEWRVQPLVALDKPYLSTTDMLQWVSDIMQKVFTYDFNHYDDQLKNASQYFTNDGWKIFLNQLNIYANYNNVQAYKLFVNSTPAGAPILLNEGLLSGRWAWWVQMPININYAGFSPPPNKTLTLQVLVVRVPTLNNLTGIGIDNVIVAKGSGTELLGNG